MRFFPSYHVKFWFWQVSNMAGSRANLVGISGTLLCSHDVKQLYPNKESDVRSNQQHTYKIHKWPHVRIYAYLCIILGCPRVMNTCPFIERNCTGADPKPKTTHSNTGEGSRAVQLNSRLLSLYLFAIWFIFVGTWSIWGIHSFEILLWHLKIFFPFCPTDRLWYVLIYLHHQDSLQCLSGHWAEEWLACILFISEVTMEDSSVGNMRY